jgi:predicted RNase H-like nuclease (RuvC/YqgF family)
MIEDSLFWFAVEVVAYAAAGICILAFVLELRAGVLQVWRETIGSWWVDRHARQMRQRIADVEAEMDEERRKRRQLEVTLTHGRRR